MQAVDRSSEALTSSHTLANLLKSAGDPLRVEILRALAQDSYGVLELSHIFATRQNSMSHHLKVLATAGLVSTRREGNSIFYRRSTVFQHKGDASDPLELTRAMLFDNVDLIELPDDIRQRIAEVHVQRAQASQAFFAEHGSSLKEKQDLIAAFEVYGEQVAAFVAQAHLPAKQRVLEVGPGEGQFLPKLAHIFAEVSALDNSSTMLESAKRFCEQQEQQNISFVAGDTSWCRQQAKKYDCIVINMVLHHTPSPQQIFADVSEALVNNGVLVICELCDHNQDWTRKACGDLWLGFEPKDLTQWAAAASLNEGQSSYFALRNGFQIQIREFIKSHP